VAAFFGVRATYRASVAIPRNLRESRALRPASDEEHEDDDDEDDQGTLAGFLLVVLGYVAVLFVFFGGPLVILVSVVLALLAEEPRRPWTLAAGMSVAWLAVLAWRLLRGAEEDEA
jgi:hypothetical protein